MKCIYQIESCETYVFEFQPIDSRMYIMIKNQEALVIDPILSEEARTWMNKRGVKNVLIILTHGHYDHILGIDWLREDFKCTLCASLGAVEILRDPHKNLSALFDVLFAFKPEEVRRQIRELNIQPYRCELDHTFTDQEVIEWQGLNVVLRETPGHSMDSICIIVENQYIFTGDTLLCNPLITRLPGGSRKIYKEKTLPFLKSLPKEWIVFPGHGEAGELGSFTISE